MPPRVTVLLPTHNRADVLPYAIRSVLWQTEPDFELLIVADGCTDSTSDVVASFPDPRIRFFNLPKAPLSGYANRNFALSQARGRYIAYAQHDDIMFPDHLAKLTESLEKEDGVWIYSRPLWCTPDGLVLPFAVNLTNRDELAHFLTAANSIPSCCVMHSRDTFQRAGFWPEDVPRLADWVYWRRVIETSGPGTLTYLPEPTVLHFRAIWKQTDHLNVNRLDEIARSANWWPDRCRLSIPANSTEQSAFFNSLAEDPAAGIKDLRAAASQIIDRLAWGTVDPSAHTWPLSSAIQEAQRDLQAVIQRQQNELRTQAEQSRQSADQNRQLSVTVQFLERCSTDLATKLCESRQALEDLSASHADLEACSRRLERSIASLRSSMSWRATYPLRKIWDTCRDVATALRRPSGGQNTN